MRSLPYSRLRTRQVLILGHARERWALFRVNLMLQQTVVTYIGNEIQTCSGFVTDTICNSNSHAGNNRGEFLPRSARPFEFARGPSGLRVGSSSPYPSGPSSALEASEDDATAPDDTGRRQCPQAAGRDSSENYPNQGQQQARAYHAGAHAHAVAHSPLRPSRAARTLPIAQQQPR